jgi:uncharacterized membrane protein YfhO
MMKGDLDLSKYLVLDSLGESQEGLGAYSNMVRYSQAAITENLPNRIKISGVSLASGYLVLTDAYYPGWECKINDNKTRISRAYCYFRAVPLKEGRFEAVFTFRPHSFRIGMIISMIGIGLWIVLAILTFTSSSKAEGLVSDDRHLHK